MTSYADLNCGAQRMVQGLKSIGGAREIVGEERMMGKK
jgi:hypothetical protein